MVEFDIEFEIKKDFRFGNYNFKKRDYIQKDNNSHVIQITTMDSLNKKLHIPYIFGADYNGMCKPIKEARIDCEEFMKKLIELNNN